MRQKNALQITTIKITRRELTPQDEPIVKLIESLRTLVFDGEIEQMYACGLCRNSNNEPFPEYSLSQFFEENIFFIVEQKLSGVSKKRLENIKKSISLKFLRAKNSIERYRYEGWENLIIK